MLPHDAPDVARIFCILWRRQPPVGRSKDIPTIRFTPLLEKVGLNVAERFPYALFSFCSDFVSGAASRVPLALDEITGRCFWSELFETDEISRDADGYGGIQPTKP